MKQNQFVTLLGYIVLGWPLWFVVSDPSIAAEIYKSVDKYGNVTYTNEPPNTGGVIEVLPTLPEPSEADIQAAIQRLKELENRRKQASQKNTDSNDPEQEPASKDKEKPTNSPATPRKLPLLAPFLSVRGIYNL